MNEKTNVLLIMVDQMRRDALGVNGNFSHTPHLDQLAREGINFSHAYSACPSCIAARASLFTGLKPVNHGFTGYAPEPEWRYKNTLPEVMAGAGYHTQCVGKMHVQPPRNLIGFHNVVLHDGFVHDKRRDHRSPGEYDDYLPWLKDQLGQNTDICDAGVGCNGYAARCWPWDERFHPTSWVTTRAIEFLRRRDTTKPFFLNVSYHRPHSPFDPPQSFFDMYENVELPEPLTGDWENHRLETGPVESPVPSGRVQQNRARRAYYSLVTQIDYELNRLFIELGDRGLWDNTLIIFVSDHGDMLFDHNLVRKVVPFEGSTGIPLIIRLPKSQRSGKSGITDRKPAELRDLFPTICDSCGIETPEGLDGQSLLSDTFERKYLHGEHAARPEWTNHWLCNGKEKYCWFSDSGRELLFHLEQDPGELHNLADKLPERTLFWRERLIGELSGRAERYVENGCLVTGRKPLPAQKWAGAGK